MIGLRSMVRIAGLLALANVMALGAVPLSA